MADHKESDVIKGWPEESREPAQLVIDKYGEPDEATESFLVWHKVGLWKRVIASKQTFDHEFPAPTRTRPKGSSTTAFHPNTSRL